MQVHAEDRGVVHVHPLRDQAPIRPDSTSRAAGRHAGVARRVDVDAPAVGHDGAGPFEDQRDAVFAGKRRVWPRRSAWIVGSRGPSGGRTRRGAASSRFVVRLGEAFEQRGVRGDDVEHVGVEQQRAADRGDQAQENLRDVLVLPQAGADDDYIGRLRQAADLRLVLAADAAVGIAGQRRGHVTRLRRGHDGGDRFGDGGGGWDEAHPTAQGSRRPARYAAPDMPRLPATTRTLPNVPLLASSSARPQPGYLRYRGRTLSRSHVNTFYAWIFAAYD